MQEALEILVDPDTDTFWAGDDTKDGRLAIPDMHGICQKIEDGKIVLDDHNRAGEGKFPDKPGSCHPLVDVKEG
jgi:hypothetical protein